MVRIYNCVPGATGPVRVAQELVLQGVQVSSGGVRGVWSRHDLLTRDKRLLRLERHVSKQKTEEIGRNRDATLFFRSEPQKGSVPPISPFSMFPPFVPCVLDIAP